MNPCPCGYYPNFERCSCSAYDVQHYLGKISGPLLDRIDMSVEVPASRFPIGMDETKTENSAEIRARVQKARERQQIRYKKYGFLYNSQLNVPVMREICWLGREEEKMMEKAFETFNLSMRSYYRTLKVARTIADLSGSDFICCEHLTEALCYRMINKKYWVGR